MTDFARLGIAVDSRTAKTASTDLGHLSREGRKASESADALTRSTNRTRDAHGRYVGQARKATQATGRFGDSAKVASSTVSAMGKAIGALAVGMAGIASAQQAVVQARGFQAALAETSTLISGTRAEMSLVEQEARRMAGTFGGTATDQVKAFYQAISSGADGVEAAAQILDQSNRLAIGGVTEVTTGVDALTTAMNAFSATGLTAAEASDAMFVGMKAGKTTIGELSAQMGQIVPIASAAGVSFDEMIAGISALTTQGQSTAMATTGLRAAITGILQPSQQASDAAKSLGLEFSASALQAKGLEQFMAEVVQTTGGNTDAMTQLFGSVEALNAVLALSGGAGQAFADTMVDMGNKAGATDEAFGKVSEGLDQRLNAAFGKLSNLAIQIGQALLVAAVPAVEALAAGTGILSDNFDTVIGIIIATGAAATGAYAPAIVGAVASTYAWVTSLVTLRGALMATGIGALVVGAGLLIGWFIKLVRATGGWGEALSLLGEVASGVWEGIKTSASSIAPALGAVWQTVKSAFYTLLETMTEAWSRFLGGLGADLAGIPVLDSFGQKLLTASGQAMAEFSEFNAKAESAASAAASLREEASDLATTGFDAARTAAAKLAAQVEGTTDATLDSEDATNALNSALDKVNKGSGKAAKGLDKVKSEAEAYADALKEAAYTTEDFGTEKANILISGIDEVSGAWGDFVSRGFSDFKGFAKNILDSFKGMLAQMITMAAKNRIMIGLGIGGVSGGQAVAGTAAQAAGGGGGLAGGLLGQVFGGNGFVGSLGANIIGGGAFTAGSGLLGGLGATANAVLGTGGSLGGLFSVGANAAAAGGGVAASIGAALPVLGAVAAAVSFFKTKTKHLDDGLRVTADNVGVLVEEFDKIQKSKFWGLSKKVSLTFSEADEATAAPIRKAIGDITGSILTAGEQLGLSADNFSSWSTKIQVSLKGLDEAARNAEIQRIFDTVAEQFSYAALGSFNDVMGGALIREGENAADTLNALVVSLQAANNGLGLVNAALFDTSVMGASMARSLTDAFGGVDNFNAAVNGYFTAFYTQEEQLAVRTGRLADQFDALNVAMPSTRDGLRDMVEAQDLNTAGGRNLYAGLVLLSGEFAELTTLSEQLYGAASLAADGISHLINSLAKDVLGAEGDLAAAKATAVTDYNNVMRIIDTQMRGAQQAALSAYRNALGIMDTEISAAEGARDAIQSIFDTLHDGLRDRRILDEEVQKIRRTQLQAELAAGITDQQRLSEVIGALNEPSEQYFSSYTDFARDYYRTSAIMSQQKGIAEDQLSEAEVQIDLLKDQKTALEDLYGPLLGIERNTDNLNEAIAAISENADELALLGEQKTAIQELYGPLLGIDENTDDLGEALARLEDAMRGVEAATLRVESAIHALASAMLQAISGIGGTQGLMGMGADAFSVFSDDRSNAIFSEVAEGVLEGTADQINSLYQDVFGRAADVKGLKFYGDLLQSGEVNSARIAYDLATSQEAQTGDVPEFSGVKSAAMPVDPVEALYGGMLGQSADPAGVEFWKSTGLKDEALINAFRDAAIANGQAPSFDGGGYTGNGSRTGGVDGLGGFWSILHPQETVIDHTRGMPFGSPAGLFGGNRDGGSTAQLAQIVAEIRKTNERLAKLESLQRQGNANTKSTARIHNDWQRSGLPKERVE